MSNFWQRALTGALFLVVMIGGIVWSFWSVSVLFFLIAMLGLHEFYILLGKAGMEPQKWIGLIIGAIFFIMIGFANPILAYPGLFIAAAIPLLVFVFFIELLRNKEKPFQNIAFTILGILYVVLPFAFWILYCDPRSWTFFDGDLSKPYNPHILLGYFFMLWTNDTGAYLSGMSLGRHKLWERISPKKTWEGFFGGVLLTLVVAYILSIYFKEIGTVLWLSIALIVSVFGTLGDLVESMFKRSLNIKESGTLLPGHGGILDRFDGVLLSAPLVVGLLYTINFLAQALNL